MKLGSLFDGIGGFPLSGTRHGFEPVWASEIEPFPVKVTQRHFPGMKHLGDITKINGAEIEPVEAISFGSPCTRLSVAGKHDGFDITFKCEGEEDDTHEIYKNTVRATDKYQYIYKDTCRICGKELFTTNDSALFFHAIRIIREMRDATNGQYPRFAVWENVPGAYSSNRGQDFRAVLAEFSDTEIPMPLSGGWADAGLVRTNRVEIAWRTLDAQYWGVPQRRKRIFLVTDFRGQCAGEILFKPESVSGDTSESQKARQEAAAAVGNSVEEPNCLNPWDCQSKRIFPEYGKMATLPAMNGGGANNQAVLMSCSGFSNYTPDTVTATQRSCVAKQTDVDLIIEPQLYDMTHAEEVMRPVEAGIAPTLNSRMGTGGNQVPVMLQPCAISLSSKQQSLVTSEDIANTLGANDYKEPQVIAFQPGNLVRQAGAEPSEEVFPTLGASTLGDQFPCVAFAANQRDEVRDLGDKAGALQAKPGMKQQTFVLQGSMIGRADKNGPQGDGINEDVSFTLNTTDRHAVAYPDPANTLLGKANLSFRDDADTVVTVDCRNLCENKELSGTLQHKESGGYSLNYQNPVRIGYAVRRLTPTEALRLQGFPDWWLDIEGMSDTAKYKAIGNSVAIPCVDFVMSGIDRVMRRV